MVWDLTDTVMKSPNNGMWEIISESLLIGGILCVTVGALGKIFFGILSLTSGVW